MAYGYSAHTLLDVFGGPYKYTEVLRLFALVLFRLTQHHSTTEGSACTQLYSMQTSAQVPANVAALFSGHIVILRMPPPAPPPPHPRFST